MQRKLWMALLAGTVLFAMSACAANTRQLLAEEQKNGAQFASWQHMGYSLFRGTPQTTTRRDIVAAQRQHWWGEVVQVAPMM
jgi:hypothetical protein